MKNAFTIDVEDYYQVEAFAGVVNKGAWGNYESRVAVNTRRLLDLLDGHSVKGTFFVLGWVAQHQRALIRSKALLEDICQRPVIGYRAATYSITNDSLWALDILHEEGFQYDSSIFPMRHDRYGIPDAQPYPNRLRTPAGYSLVEFPISVFRSGALKLPVAGGGYFRLFPYPVTRWGLSQINRSGHEFVFYLHPWEVDPEQPRIREAGALSRFRHYLNLAQTRPRLERLLQDFSFTTMENVLRGQALL
jgi:polysaccharide deacetylase family protein (PEP-CTERM system associated)